MNVDLLVFLTTGNLGDLSVGMSQAQVIATMGAPDAVAGGREAPEILRYGRVQVMCEDGLVKAVFVRVGANLGAHPGISLVGWIPPATMSLDETTAFLASHRLAFIVETSNAYFTTLRIADSRVRLAFSDGELDRLYAQRD